MAAEEQGPDPDVAVLFDAVEKEGFASFPNSDGRTFVFKTEFLERIVAERKAKGQPHVMFFCQAAPSPEAKA